MTPFDLLRAVRDMPLPSPTDLTATDKLVLALLAMRADPSGCCWTSYTTLAANGWMGVRTAKTAIARLVAAGLVEIHVRRVDEGEGGKLARVANGYRVLVRGAEGVVHERHDVVPPQHDLARIIHPANVTARDRGGEATTDDHEAMSAEA